VTELSLYIPGKRVSAWLAETDPKYAREWLAALPLADSGESARELYQALYTLNRQELEIARRYELMELYAGPVATVAAGLQANLARLALPLTPKKRQLAEFLCQLYLEMANGYKCCLHDLQQQRILWGKRHLIMRATARAMHYLGEVLYRSYLVYMPSPPRVWQEIHQLYRYAEATGRLNEAIPPPSGEADATHGTILQRYLQMLLLAACNPYQLPQNECIMVNRFLGKWALKASINPVDDSSIPPSSFLMNLAADSPPAPFVRDSSLPVNAGWRVLNAVELTRTLEGFIHRLQKGESTKTLDLGVDCLDSACLDLLQRLLRAWGLVVRRQHARIKRHGNVFLCTGMNAIHFFANGQKSFTPPTTSAVVEYEEAVKWPGGLDKTEKPSADQLYVALDEPDLAVAPTPANIASENVEVVANAPEWYRIDRWLIQDISPKGVLLAHSGDAATHVRVGDLVGIQRVNETGHWSVGVVRWLRSPQNNNLETGIELFAPRLMPVTIGVATDSPQRYRYAPALLLPEMNALHRPATLLLTRGVFHPGSDLFLMEGEAPMRRIRPLKVLERAGSFEQIVFADVRED
jgi:hypothetical protein